MESYTKRGYYKVDILLFPLIAFQDKLDQVINRCLNNGTSAGGEPGSAFHWSERSATPLTHTHKTRTQLTACTAAHHVWHMTYPGSYNINILSIHGVGEEKTSEMSLYESFRGFNKTLNCFSWNMFRNAELWPYGWVIMGSYDESWVVIMQ